MAVVKVGLDQVLAGLKGSLHTIDVRSAVKKVDSGWAHVLTGIRISARSVEAVKQRYIELEKKFGRKQTSRFRILWEVLPITELDRISSELASNALTVEQEQLRLHHSTNFRDLKSWVERRYPFVKPWTSEHWPGLYCFSGDSSPVAEELTADIRSTVGLRSVNEMLDAFLEVSNSGRHRLDLFVHVEMPARISNVIWVGQTVHVEVTAEENLRNLHLFLCRYDSNGTTPIANIELPLDAATQTDRFILSQTTVALESATDQDIVSCILTHEIVPELDEVTGRLRDFMPPQEKNPLLECLKQFWDMEKLYQQVQRPYELSTHRVEVRPQLAFQKSVARLLNLAGFQAVDLERDDKMYHPETNVERATIDVLAYHKDSRILVLGACTIYVPKTEDYDKLLHATTVLGKLFPKDSLVRLVPVLFAAQENVSPFRGEVAQMGMRLMNVHELTVLRKLIEKGDEDRFIYFLTSPLEAELREKSVYEP